MARLPGRDTAIDLSHLADDLEAALQEAGFREVFDWEPGENEYAKPNIDPICSAIDIGQTGNFVRFVFGDLGELMSTSIHQHRADIDATCRGCGEPGVSERRACGRKLCHGCLEE